MTINSFTKDQLEVVESLPEGEKLEEEEEKYVDTKDYDDLVFSNSASSTDPNVDPSDDYYSSAKGLDDFIMGFDAENGTDKKDSADKKPWEKVKKPKNRASIRAAAKAAKKARKAAKMAACKNRKKNAGKEYAKLRKQIKLLKAKKARKATTVQLKPKKSSTASKKASMDLKKAA